MLLIIVSNNSGSVGSMRNFTLIQSNQAGKGIMPFGVYLSGEKV